MKILFVEDQQRIGAFLTKSFSEREFSVTWVQTGREARDALAISSYDVVVLDLGLPDMDGLDLLREWRNSGFNQPVLILSARDAVEDRINGLNVGADDYLAKPFSLEELQARIRSVLRRKTGARETTLEHRGIEMDLLRRVVTVNGEVVDLTSREYMLLEFFMHNNGRILTRTLICEKIWESRNEADTNLLDVYMSKLRAKLERSAEKPFFKTVRGVGYNFL